MSQKIQHCPVCGERVGDNDGSEEVEGNVYTFFLCKHESHYAPYALLECTSMEHKNAVIVVSSSIGEVVMQGKKLYCCSCGSALTMLVTYTEETTSLRFYECAKEGHVWHVVDEIKRMMFTFYSLYDFDTLLRICGSVSRHHIRIPMHLTKRSLWKLSLRDRFVM